MTYDFDKVIDRKGSSSLKWDWYKGRDVIPLWVADMDFPASEEILRALHKRIDHGVFGYTLPPDEIFRVIMDSLQKTYGWEIKREWIEFIPGVVSGLNITCRAIGNTGDEIMVPTPVYPPFFEAPVLSGRKPVTVEMVEKSGRLVFDLSDVERKITEKTRGFLLCSPHNPGGTVFTEEELLALYRICEKHDIIVCSDEIHCDLVLSENVRHIPTASLKSVKEENVITLMAPSKTYNIPGMGCSFAIIPDENLRKKFKMASEGIVPHVNLMGYEAAIAAYRDSASWLAAVIEYLRENRDMVVAAVEKMPGLSVICPESTYLAWIDATELPVKNPTAFFEEAGVGLSNGKFFGNPGFVRLNFGCSRALLKEALKRMENAVCRLSEKRS